MKRVQVAIIINSASYDRVSYALTIATTSAALLNEVHVLFTYGAVNRLVKGHADDIGEETDSWIRKDITSGVEQGHMKRISEMLSYLKGFGGTLYACSAAIAFHRLTRDDLIEEVDEIIGISTFLEQTTGATLIYV